MGANYNVKLTSGDITPGALYTVYYNSVNTGNIATLLSTNQPAQNLTLSELLNGVDVDIPNSATKIIIDSVGFCNNSFEILIQPVNTILPPELCLSYRNTSGLQKVDFTPSGTQNGKTKWISNSLTLYYNNVPTPPQWTIDLDSSNKFILISNNDVPEGNWSLQGQNTAAYSSPVVTRGVCENSCTLEITVEKENSRPNSSTGSIFVTATGGNTPYQYYLDDVGPQLSNRFVGVSIGTHVVKVVDANFCVATLIVEIGEIPPPPSKVLSLVGNEVTVLQNSTTISKKNNWQLKVTQPLTQGEEIKFDLTFNEIFKLFRPGTGTLSRTITASKNNINLPSPIISTLTNTDNREDCNSPNIPLETTGNTIVYKDLTLKVGDIISGTAITTLSIPRTSGQIYDSCVTKLSEEITYTLTPIPTITNGIGNFTIVSSPVQGPILKSEIIASDPTNIQSIFTYRESSGECLKEQSNPFNIVKTITNFSSPGILFWDNTLQRLYVGDLDSVLGNVYYINDPINITNSSQITRPPGSPQSNNLIGDANNRFFFTAEVDPVFRRIYFAGILSSGVTVYNIATDTTVNVNTGNSVVPNNRVFLTFTNNFIYHSDREIGIGNVPGYRIINRNNLQVQPPFLFDTDTQGYFYITQPYARFISVPSANTQNNLWVYAGLGGSINTNAGRSIGLYRENFQFIRRLFLTGSSFDSPTQWVDPAQTDGIYRFWQYAFYDSDNKVFYLNDIGSNMVYVVDTVSLRVIYTRKLFSTVTKNFCAVIWNIDPVTNKLYETHILIDKSNDTTPIYHVYEVNRQTYNYITFYKNTTGFSLTRVGNTRLRASVSPNLLRYQGGNWNTDGTITFFDDTTTQQNTGTYQVNFIQEYEQFTNQPVGAPIPNVVGQTGYIPPSLNDPRCPVNQTLSAPSVILTQKQSGSTRIHYYEMALSGSVVSNQTVQSIDVIYVINSVNVTTQTISRPNIKTYLTGSYIRNTSNELPYQITVRYKNSSGTILAEYPNLS